MKLVWKAINALVFGLAFIVGAIEALFRAPKRRR
jgi:hypothetical protein